MTNLQRDGLINNIVFGTLSIYDLMLPGLKQRNDKNHSSTHLSFISVQWMGEFAKKMVGRWDRE
jgi:hypothetical protein